MKKRAQITLFIIIGIIVLAASATVVYIKQKGAVGIEAKEEREPVIAKLPSEFDPVRTYVETCVRQVAVDALAIMGEHGGYIDLTDDELGMVVLVDEIVPTDSDAVEFGPGTGLAPYWYYLESNNDLSDGCRFSSLRPPLKRGSATGNVPSSASMEEQLDRYVNAELSECVRGFEALEIQGFEITAEQPNTRTTIAEDEVRFYVEYPLTVKKGAKTTKVKQFYVKVPVKLKRIYEFAKALVEDQRNYSYLERNLQEWIAIYSDLDTDKLPPTYDLGIEFGGSKIWIKQKVIERLQTVIAMWTQFLQVKDTLNYDRIIISEDQKYHETMQRLYDNMAIPRPGFGDLGVTFDYLDWPMYFMMNKRNQEIIKSKESIGIPFPVPVGVQMYTNVYDVSYPVYVEIKQPPTLDFNKGYRFGFFIESNLRSNEPFKCGNEQYYIPDIPRSLLCEENQRISGDITIEITDGEAPMKDAKILYGVSGQVCFIGKTNEDGILVAKLPITLGGIITAAKDDYLGKSTMYDAEINKSESISLTIAEIKTIKVGAEKIMLGTVAHKKLDKIDEVVVTLQKIKSDPGEEEFVTGVRISGNETSDVEMRIVSGSYDIKAYLLVNKERHIPPETRCAFKMFGACVKKYTIPAIDLPSPHPWGGSILKSQPIPPPQLKLKEKIVFKVWELPELTRVEDLQPLSDLDALTQEHRIMLMPDFR